MNEEDMVNIENKKEYILSGTITEIISALIIDFDLSEDEARFVVYNLTIEKQDKVVFTEKDLKLWYMNEETPSTAPIFNLPYTISITQLTLEMQHMFFIFFGTLTLSKEVGIVALGLDFIWALKQAIQKIDKDEYCVYGRVVDFVHATDRDSFELRDIIPYDQDNECNRKPEKWDCIYWNSDKCSLTEEHIVTILDNLVGKGVLTKKNQYWKMVK